ncbi:MAG: sulfatase-like hydrolase/transferase [Microthrixaceae bacterium]
MTRPNILVVLSDQQRPDSCGVFGQRLAVTPRLDRLAADGVAFDNAFTIQPVCGPARAAIQTGSYPTTTGCWRNGIALPPGQATLADRIDDLGYQTGYVGKWHLASDRGAALPIGRSPARFERRPVPPERRGGYRDCWVAADALEHTSGAVSGHVFDEHGQRVELSGYRVDALTDIAIDRLGRFDTDRPFLLFVSFLEPHHQNNRFRAVGPEGWAARFSDFDRPEDLPAWRGDWRWNYAEYLACCASIDTNLGRMVDHLERSGRLDDTLVVFSSDHGNHFRTRNLEYKRSPHDASLRIPLVLRGPGFRGGQRRQDMATSLDLLPTLVVAAGGDDPCLDGRPLQLANERTRRRIRPDQRVPDRPGTAHSKPHLRGQGPRPEPARWTSTPGIRCVRRLPPVRQRQRSAPTPEPGERSGYVRAAQRAAVQARGTDPRGGGSSTGHPCPLTELHR